MKEEHFEILLEDIQSKFQLVLEALSTFPTREEVKAMLADKTDKEDFRFHTDVIKEELANVKTELAKKPDREDLEAVRRELKGEIQEVRRELKGEIQEVRRELKGEIQEVRQELDKKPDKEDLEKIHSVLTNHENRIGALEKKAS